MQFNHWLFLFGIALFPKLLQGQDTLVYTDASASVNPMPYIGYLEDKDHTYGINDILEMPDTAFQQWAKGENINFGFSASKYWLSLNIDNQTQERLLLIEENPMINYLNLYIIDELGAIQTIESGSFRAFDTRSYKTSLFSFDIGKQPKNIVLEIYVKGTKRASK